jgi:hypothetical protein
MPVAVQVEAAVVRSYVVLERGPITGYAWCMTTFERVGDEDWRGVRAAVMHDGRLFVVANTTMYVVDPHDGSCQTYGSESWKSAFLISAGGRLLSLEETGTLYEVTEAGYTLIEGDWRNTTALVTKGDAFFTVSNGTLYKVDPQTAEYLTVGSDSWKPRFLLTLGGKLFSVEESGTLYSIDPWTGEYQALAGDWRNATCGAVVDGALCILASGTWYRVDPATGEDTAIEMDTSWDTVAAIPFADQRFMLCFERSGSLWKFSLDASPASSDDA